MGSTTRLPNVHSLAISFPGGFDIDAPENDAIAAAWRLARLVGINTAEYHAPWILTSGLILEYVSGDGTMSNRVVGKGILPFMVEVISDHLQSQKRTRASSDCGYG